ncbi:MAG: bifunctional hydroxymethylpyrimidine kinase/phosphomethylpyrimidine kinase [Actinomycetales bacterium]
MPQPMASTPHRSGTVATQAPAHPAPAGPAPAHPAPVPPDLRQVPRVLSIAGSDPSGGAGIQADLKSIAANGGYGMAAITALTAQNTLGVLGVHVPPADFLTAQLNALADDIVIDAVKIGMLANAEVIRAVHDWLLRCRPAVVVLDPVMVSSSGSRLLAADAEDALRSLLPLADVLTPNLPELAVLLDLPLALDWPDAVRQGQELAAAAGTRVLVKGGHLAGDQARDALVQPDGATVEFAAARVSTRNTHGTGCSTSAALATVAARRGDWTEAVGEVKAWLHGALEHADELQVGSGHGPVNHFHELWAAAPPRSDGFSGSL